ncbi:MAG: hypothetical protein MJ145_03755, partial [Clostridia bacterium]|nr:hypothetical protein [Clostridia bacterium]
TEVAVGERHAYLLDMDDVVSLTKAERTGMFPSAWCCLRSADSDYNDSAWCEDGVDGSFHYEEFDYDYCVYASFTINLKGLDFEILE